MALYGSIADLDVESISKTHSIDAIGLFIYDTRKDTDGGAWRKRTHHTSWYNETLNTSIRGSRKEFPAIAVLVKTSTKVIIYDGDHPDLPMWMEFDITNTGATWSGEITTSNFDMLTGGTPAKKSLAMMNGVLVNGGATSVNTVNFISERSVYRGATSNTDGVYRGTIAERNDNKGHKLEQNLGLLANASCDDVAITVLPNAPVDPGSGLPTPTIACATPGGLTIIKDDGTGTFNITASAGASYNGVSFVNISEDYYLIFEQDSDTNSRSVFYIPIPTSARTTATNDGSITDKVILKFYNNNAHSPYPTFNGGGVEEAIPMAGHNQAFRSNSGDGGAGYTKQNMLTLLETTLDKEQGRVAYITSDFNTGWMTGDNILCVLADTDDTNISASEKVTNHDFSNGTTGWTLADSNEGSISVSGGQLTLTNSTAADPPVNCYQAISLTEGKYYALYSDHASGNIAAINIVDTPSSNGGNDGYGNVVYHDTAGSKRRSVFRATSQTNYVVIRVNTNATGTTVMNTVSITEAEPDRGPWGKFERDRMSGVKSYGNITKTAVATGAELVSYNNFNASNYFAQYMDQSIGTGDFSFTFWVNPPSSPNGYFHVISIGTEAAGGQSSGTGIVLKLNASDSSPYFYTGAGGASQSTYNAVNQFSPGAWNQFVGGRSGGRFYMYINGKLSITGNTNSFNISDTYLTIGRGINHNEYDTNTKLALIRISKTFPEADHIAKMYEDEKVLFQENAKATLYGTSDAVKAFAYDSTTKLLHAGTSAGRSVFQGLRRVDNTTTAVGSRISASNGMVAED